MASNDIGYYFIGPNITGSTFPMLLRQNATAGVVAQFENSNTANSTANAQFRMTVGGANAGDPFLYLGISAVQDWSIGVDNSDSDILKIGPNSCPSSGTTAIAISTIGNIGMGTTPTATNRLTLNYVDNTVSSNTAASFALTKTVASDNGNAVYANTNTLTLSGAGSVGNAIGTMNFLVLSGASGTGNVARGTYSRVGTFGTTNAASLAMYVTHFEGDGTGTIANWYGMTVGSVGGSFAAGRFTNNSQTITNTYGLYIGDITSGAQTNTPWAIYQDDTGVRSWLASPLFIGGTVTNPTALLDLGASTVSRAPLRLRSGVAPTAPNEGDIWYDGTDVKVRVAGVTRTFVLI
jgi:hypothetical protein